MCTSYIWITNVSTYCTSYNSSVDCWGTFVTNIFLLHLDASSEVGQPTFPSMVYLSSVTSILADNMKPGVASDTNWLVGIRGHHTIPMYVYICTGQNVSMFGHATVYQMTPIAT